MNEETTSAAALLGKRGGLATASKMTPEQRKARAKAAANKRWEKKT